MLLSTSFLKKVWIYRYAAGAGVIIAGAVILRIILSSLTMPTPSSDEAMNNLAALHIAKNGEHPIFFYGQNYLGSFEAYLGALLFRVAGPSLVGMRLEMIALYALFLTCLYFLTKKLFSKGLALITLACLLFVSPWTIYDQVAAIGYPELPLFTALLCLIACVVAISYHQLSAGKRALLYALWGLVAGVALWIQLLLAPYILVSGLLIVICCWEEFFKRAIWLILPAFLLGAAPLLYYNLTAAPGQDSLHTFLALSHMGYNPHDGLIMHLERGLLITLPVANGATPFCALNGIHPFSCLVILAPEGLGYLALMLAGFILAGVALQKLYRLDRSPEHQQQRALQLGRLMLLCGAVLSLISLIQGNALNISATTSGRYLICTLVSLPAVLWPLWTFDHWFQSFRARSAALALKWGVLLLIAFALVYSTIHVVQNVPDAQKGYQQLLTLEQTLENRHITRFYSNYWMCGKVTFDTQEQLICAVTNNDLSHGLDRYFPYRTMVEQDPHPSFVFADGAAQITLLNQLLAKSHVQYERIELPGYVIYQMEGRIPSLAL